MLRTRPSVSLWLYHVGRAASSKRSVPVASRRWCTRSVPAGWSSDRAGLFSFTHRSGRIPSQLCECVCVPIDDYDSCHNINIIMIVFTTRAPTTTTTHPPTMFYSFSSLLRRRRGTMSYPLRCCLTYYAHQRPVLASCSSSPLLRGSDPG